jgi:hypothetical protein
MPTPARERPSPEELGPPVAYLALKDGTPVYDRNGTRIGVVENVMAVGNIFEGLMIHTHPLPGRHLYADAAQVAEIREHGVLLSADSDEHHDPRREAGHRQRDGQQRGLEARLRRAFDWLTRRT